MNPQTKGIVIGFLGTWFAIGVWMLRNRMGGTLIPKPKPNVEHKPDKR